MPTRQPSLWQYGQFCRHCSRDDANRLRSGLCTRCYKRYSSLYIEPRIPIPDPTQPAPGPLPLERAARVAELARRAEAGQQLVAEYDRHVFCDGVLRWLRRVSPESIAS